MRTLKELINLQEPGWDLVQEWMQDATNDYKVLPRELARAEEELVHAQVTTRSPMGAVIYETGGILIDHGWLRILGSGSLELDRGMMQWNRGKTFQNESERPAYLLVGDDVLGGIFAINGGGLGEDMGNIYYLPQDTLTWESLEFGYSDFLYWALHGDLKGFYELFRWQNWQNDTQALDGNHVFAFYPFLWTKEGKEITKVERKIVPIEENYHVTMELQENFTKQ